MVESWTKGSSSLNGNSQLCYECEIREQRIVLRPRTGLNGGERGQEQVRQAKRPKKEVEDRPRTNLNGGELVQSFFCLMAAWLYVSIVRAVALLLALTKQHEMQRILHRWQLYRPIRYKNESQIF